MDLGQQVSRRARDSPLWEVLMFMSGSPLPSRRVHPFEPRRSYRVAKVLRLGALAGGLLIAGLGTGAPRPSPPRPPMVDLGEASTLRGAERRLRRQHRQRPRRPAHDAPRRPRRQGERPADRLSAGRRHRREARRQRGRRRCARRPRRGLHRGRRPDGRRAARGRAGRHDDLAGPAHHRRRRVEHRRR